MTTFYSKTTAGFYPANMRADYDAAGTWPADAVAVTDEDELIIRAGLASGGTVTGAPGAWVVTPPQAETVDDIRKRAIVQIRTIRAPMLDALDGIAGRAARKGDNATAQGADDAADALLEIMEWPAFMEATTYDGMQAAILDRYTQISAAAPQSVQVVFREVLGI